VIVGDSFIWEFLLPNLAESFSQLVFIHYDDMDNLNKIIAEINPDIVIQAGLGSGVAYTFASYTYGPPANFYAQIVSTNTPTEIERDKLYEVNIVVKNTGTESWGENKAIRLCIFVNGKDYGYRVYLPNNVEIKPGEEYTFTIKNFQASNNNSIYVEYQMVQEGFQFFGEKKRVDIAIKK
jgi:hypothetical protein